ncbi:hypothetical protein Bca52824_089287 [Brassica carinata]|uniref:Ubiquitin-like protease family profile domain-containing protein n=1 Tax=Brassica carinata TaxID=52824 RepID=A0A8X7TQ08_BRACI|nr:hypothetical protein Bca52824_089287 [Brassica carinata]
MGLNYLSRRCRFVDYFSIAGIISKFASSKASDKLGFNWEACRFDFTGKMQSRMTRRCCWLMWAGYALMMWGKDHWVGLVINLTCGQVEILDCNIPLMSPIMRRTSTWLIFYAALPHVLAAFCLLPIVVI